MPSGGFVLSTMLFGGAVTFDIAISIVLIVAGIFVTLRRRGNLSATVDFMASCG